MTPLRRAETEWAKRTYGSSWRRVFVQRRGNGSMNFALETFRAGWLAATKVQLQRTFGEIARRAAGMR